MSYLYISHVWLVHAPLALGSTFPKSTLSLVLLKQLYAFIMAAIDGYSQVRVWVKGQVGAGQEEYTTTIRK